MLTERDVVGLELHDVGGVGVGQDCDGREGVLVGVSGEKAWLTRVGDKCDSLIIEYDSPVDEKVWSSTPVMRAPSATHNTRVSI